MNLIKMQDVLSLNRVERSFTDIDNFEEFHLIQNNDLVFLQMDPSFGIHSYGRWVGVAMTDYIVLRLDGVVFHVKLFPADIPIISQKFNIFVLRVAYILLSAKAHQVQIF